MTATETLQKAMENGKIPVRLEEDVVRFRVGRLYASPASGFRELFANELRACRIARAKHGADPRIEITINMTEPTVVIHGIDSLGITEEKFINTLSVLGETDNQEGSEVGQWGWGVAAAFGTLSDSITYETRARETGERYAFLGLAGEHFSKMPQPDLASPGTRVTIYPRKEIKLSDLAEQARHICAYADVETRLRIINEPVDKEHLDAKVPWETLNNPDITRNLPEGELIQVEDEDFSLAGVITEHDHQRPAFDTRLLGMPIQAEALRLPFDAYVLQIKDERKYRPTADRERLTDKAVEALAVRIDAKLREALSRALDIGSFNDFRRKQCSRIYYIVSEHWGNVSKNGAWDFSEKKKQALRELYKPSALTLQLSELLRLTVRILKNSGDLGTESVNLGEVVKHSNNLFLASNLDHRMEDILRLRNNDAVIFAPKAGRIRGPGYVHGFGFDTVTKMQEQGIRTDTLSEVEDIKSTMEKHRRPALPRSEPPSDSMCIIVVHTSRVREFEEHGDVHRRLADRPDEMRLSDAPEDTIFVPSIDKYIRILMKLNARQGISRLDKIPKTAHARRLTLDRFLEQKANHEVVTNRGILTFNDLVKRREMIRILLYEDDRLAGVYGGKGVIAPLPDSEAFLLAVYLQANNIPYTIDEVPSETEFKKATGRERWDYDYHENNYNQNVNLTINAVYHVGLAVKDERIRRLFFTAAKTMPPEDLMHLLTFTFNTAKTVQANNPEAT